MSYRFTTRLKINLSTLGSVWLKRLEAGAITYKFELLTIKNGVSNLEVGSGSFNAQGFSSMEYYAQSEYSLWSSARDTISAFWYIYIDGVEVWKNNVREMFADGDQRWNTAIIVRHTDGQTQKIKEGDNPNTKEQNISAPNGTCCQEAVPAIAPTPASAEYYQKRYDNFVERHKKCGGNRVPPVYYLGFGKKYCTRFLTETYAQLSPNGKAWMMDVLKNLQKFMEQGVVEQKFLTKDLNDTWNNKFLDEKGQIVAKKLTQFYTGIECRSEDHRAFAFATHPDAYMPRRMASELTCKDLILVGATPDRSEWHGFGDNTWSHAGDTLSQARSVMTEMGVKGNAEVLGRCAKEAGVAGWEGAKGAANSAADAAKDVLKKGRDAIKDVF